jgi:hypothetical protein
MLTVHSRNRSIRLMIGFVLAAFALSFTLATQQPAQAGGMGGIDVRPARVCLNGVRFTGTLTDAAALNRKITGEIFRGHVGVPTPLVATGNSHVYTAVGQTKSFTITYPVGTFAVGEDVTYSAITNDGSGYGGGQFGKVEKCYLRRVIRFGFGE